MHFGHLASSTWACDVGEWQEFGAYETAGCSMVEMEASTMGECVRKSSTMTRLETRLLFAANRPALPCRQTTRPCRRTRKRHTERTRLQRSSSRRRLRRPATTDLTRPFRTEATHM